MSATRTARATRATWQKEAVRDLLARTDGFRSAQQLHAALEAESTKVGLATVYRNLTAMAASGEVDQVRSDDGELLYRSCTGTAHHHHLVCRRCGAAVEVSAQALEAWVAAVSAEHGFTQVTHTAEFFGLCRHCSQGSGGSGPSGSAGGSGSSAPAAG